MSTSPVVSRWHLERDGFATRTHRIRRAKNGDITHLAEAYDICHVSACNDVHQDLRGDIEQHWRTRGETWSIPQQISWKIRFARAKVTHDWAWSDESSSRFLVGMDEEDNGPEQRPPRVQLTEHLQILTVIAAPRENHVKWASRASAMGFDPRWPTLFLSTNNNLCPRLTRICLDCHPPCSALLCAST